MMARRCVRYGWVATSYRVIELRQQGANVVEGLRKEQGKSFTTKADATSKPMTQLLFWT